MKLREILEGITGLKAKGNIDIDVSNVTTDSRKVSQNGMFIAVKRV